MPIFIINLFFNNITLGLYALANRVILTPMAIVTASYSQVFMQKLTNNHHERKNELIFFKSNVLKLMVYSFLPFLIFFIFSPQIFLIIFGNNWVKAGVYAQILTPMLYVRFTGSIVSSVTIIYNQQKKALNIEVFNSIIRVLSLIIGGLFENIILGLILFSLSSSIITIFRLFWYVDIIKKGIKNAI